jgi:hypothetical protein
MKLFEKRTNNGSKIEPIFLSDKRFYTLLPLPLGKF